MYVYNTYMYVYVRIYMYVYVRIINDTCINDTCISIFTYFINNFN